MKLVPVVFVQAPLFVTPMPAACADSVMLPVQASSEASVSALPEPFAWIVTEPKVVVPPLKVAFEFDVKLVFVGTEKFPAIVAPLRVPPVTLNASEPLLTVPPAMVPPPRVKIPPPFGGASTVLLSVPVMLIVPSPMIEIVPLVRSAVENVPPRFTTPLLVAIMIPVFVHAVFPLTPRVSVLPAPVASSVPALATVIVPPPVPKPMFPPIASIVPAAAFVIESVPASPRLSVPDVEFTVPLLVKLKPVSPPP